MKSKKITENIRFIGRKIELEIIANLETKNEASILIVYGRRRIGKTELVEQGFRNRNLLKFEGIEGGSKKAQIEYFLLQLSEYLEDPYISKLKLNSWIEALSLLAKHISSGKYTIYFEEVQWLSCYREKFISELKYIWDNKLKQNRSLVLVLCGSSPSFMINKILHSKALYNRSHIEVPLNEFSIEETHALLGLKRSIHEILDCYLIFGGVPEYLKQIKKYPSVFTGVYETCFKKGGFFVDEHKRIFISSMSENKYYKKIVEFLSKRKFANRNEIADHLKIKSGGGLTDLLADLELSGFIENYTPFNFDDKSILSRYSISDCYLRFYFKFISPIKKRIESGEFNKDPSRAIKLDNLKKWLGFSFERFCRKNHKKIAELLGFKAVSYKYGTFFNRNTDKIDSGYQLDLIFDREDKVYTICEIKYYDSKVSTNIIDEMQTKIELFPNPKNRTIHKILITTYGATESLILRNYFDEVITLEDLLK